MRVLVVEDEKKIADFLRTGFEAECFSVDIATDGEQGSYLGRVNEYDMIILDNLLPKKIGQEVCEEIRDTGKTTPILILSVKSETHAKVDLLNAGADDYLTKPFSFEELLARVRALIRRPNIIQGEVLALADLTVDTRSHIVTRGTQSIHLTRKEFMLLEYLLRNRGTVLSRAMILEHVWDMNTDPFSNTIESHILSLRKKIERPKKIKLIHTISGRGYKIDTA